jgi:predicted TIM-barrel fold metal-dependent hydrolase
MSLSAAAAIQLSKPNFTVPAGACDCHVHIFGPTSSYPWDAERDYTPGDASTAELVALQRGLGLDRAVIVHPSPYGPDNRRTIDAIQELGMERARGVAVIDPAIDDADLQRLSDAGICGARVLLETKGLHDPALAAPLLRETARRIKPFGWHLQTYTRLPVIAALLDLLADLPVPLVIDHFGRADAAAGVTQPGFDALLSLVRSGKAYVKLSAPHRLSKDSSLQDVAPIARALIGANPERMLWGTDWPHTGGRAGGGEHEIEPFNQVDDGAVLNRLAEWAGDDAMLRQILVGNPARLYGF